MRLRVTYQHNPVQGLGKQKNEKGFTIVEVLMAISIFAVGLLAVATMQYSAIKVNSSANHLTIRTTVAMDRLEQIMAWQFTNANLVDNNPNVGVVTTYPDFDPNPPAGITISYTVDNNNPIQRTKLITVTVSEGIKTTRLTTIKFNI